MNKQIVLEPADILSTKAKEVKEISDEIYTLVDEMTKAMLEKQGIGLAAPQIGDPRRIAIIHGIFWQMDLPLVMINPRIISYKHPIESEEGCLSLPDRTFKMKRYRHVTVEFMQMDGRKARVPMADTAAICAQHEVDHLDGFTVLHKCEKEIQKDDENESEEDIKEKTSTKEEPSQDEANQSA